MFSTKKKNRSLKRCNSSSNNWQNTLSSIPVSSWNQIPVNPRENILLQVVKICFGLRLINKERFRRNCTVEEFSQHQLISSSENWAGSIAIILSW